MRSPRSTSRCCWTVPSISCSSCAFAQWRGRAWGGGRLFNDDEFQPLRNELETIARELNAESIEQVVYAWILRLPSKPLPIIGSGKIERVRSALAAEELQMTRQQWFRIRKAALGYDVP
ncbi:aldo/keto reductase [Enterobacter asburiae]|uniref:Aldo/keto reductase n=1 Tax=Enterobacter asburiae TaxID=61645 RepID=A0A376F850_ENTAS|nr:aldo/keto reductase [Enterobacter asburiae]